MGESRLEGSDPVRDAVWLLFVVGVVGDSPLFIVATKYLARSQFVQEGSRSFLSRGVIGTLVWTVLNKAVYGHLFLNHHTEITYLLVCLH